MKRVLLVSAIFFCIVFGKRYPRDFNDSVGMIRRTYADGAVPKNALKFTREKDMNLKKFYENFERVSILDDRLKYNGTQNSFKIYPKVNQFRLGQTMSRNNDLKNLSHQDHSKENSTQDQKENLIKDVNKNKNIKEVINHDHRGENIHKHLKRTTDVDTILKLVAERSMNVGTQTDSQRKKTFQKDNDGRGSNAHTKYSEWLILPNHNVNSINDFKNDSIRNFVNYQNSNFNEQSMKKSENPNVLNTGRGNPDIFKYIILGMRKGKGFKNLGSRGPNIRNMQNENTDIQYGINFQKRNFEKIDPNDSRVVNPTVRSLTDYPSLNSSQYQNFEKQNTVDYENLKFGKQSFRDFAKSEIPTTRNNMENLEINIPTNNSVSEQFETLWKSENGVNAKSIFENRTKFQTFSFEPGQPNQYPGLREIYRKNLDSNFISTQSSPKREHTGIPMDNHYLDREHSENLPAGEIFHQSRVVVENSIVPTKMSAKDDLEKVYKSVRFFFDHRVKREDYYRLPLKENKKDSTISSKKYSKNQSKLGNDKNEVFKIRNSEEQKSQKKKISNKVPSSTKDSIRDRDTDELSLNLKDNIHDYFFEEEFLTKAEEQDDNNDSTNDIPKTMDTVIFKREIAKNESVTENPSSSNLTVSEMLQKNIERINSKNKLKNNNKRTDKDETDEKKASKIGLKNKVSKKKHHKANKNDPSKFKPGDMKEVGSKTDVSIPEKDRQAPNFNNDRIKKKYFTMTKSVMDDALNEESNHESKSSAQVDDTGSVKTNDEQFSINLPISKDPKRSLDNDQITPFKRNNLVYKPYVMEIESRSMKKKNINKQSEIKSDFVTFIDTSKSRLATPDHLEPTDVNFEVYGKQSYTKNNERRIDECSGEDSVEDHDDKKKEWPISPGPITCDPDYEVSTTFAAKPTEYPFVVSIQYKNVVSKELSHICNGVIVGPKFVVSAAHCLNNHDNFELVVQPSHDLCDVDVRSVPVVLVMEHENYNRHTRMNDLALLRLKYEIDADQVSFPENDTIYNDFYSVGWGELMWNHFKKSVTKIQQKLPVSRYSDKTKETAGTIYVNTAGLDITGAFRGDYGGILMNGKKEFIGVQSKLYPDEDYEVFMRIRTYLPWIENMMKTSKRLLDDPYKFRSKKG